MLEDKIKQIHHYMEELKTNRMELLEAKANFLSIEKYQCSLNNGQKIIREKLLKGKIDGSAAIIMAVTENQEFILAIEPRVFTKETVDVGLPAGYIEEGEEAIKAAQRELLEETGYIAQDWIPLGSFYQDQGCSGAYNHYFLATQCRKVKEQNLDEGEFIKYVLVSDEELNWLLDHHYINGLNSAYTIEKAQRLIRK